MHAEKTIPSASSYGWTFRSLHCCLQIDMVLFEQPHLVDEGITPTEEFYKSKENLEEHRNKICSFLVDSEKGSYILEDTNTHKQIGTIMYLIANRDKVYPWRTIYQELDRSLFQEDGRFMEIFQLWIDPEYRRNGLGTKLKKRLEDRAMEMNTNLIYTHTEESNEHVIDLNKKLGYREVRRGPIWDEIIRVSLIKQLV